ncbi:hypothetical protein WA158_003708 [Blastocystis sp. Blastoise]
MDNDEILELHRKGRPIWKTFLSGTISGGIAESIMFPTETLSTRMKVGGMSNLGFVRTVSQIVKYEGVVAFYRGIDTIIWSSLPAKGVYFTAYETVKRLGTRYLPPQFHSIVYLVAGMSSEICSSFIYVPFEMVKARMQVGSTWGQRFNPLKKHNSRIYPNALYGVREVCRKEGFRGLYQGYFSCIATDCCQSGFQFLFYEELKRFSKYITGNHHISAVEDMVYGLMAGAMACCVSNPLDMITCRLFCQNGRNDLYKYKGFFDIMKTVYKIEGLRAFYAGLSVKMVQLAPLAVRAQSITCPYPKEKFLLKRTYKAKSTQETVQIWENSTSQGEMVYSFTGLNKENQVVFYELCLKQVNHVLVAIDSKNDGWEYGSTFELMVENSVVLLKGTLDYYSRQEWPFYPHTFITADSKWSYTDLDQSGNDWISPSFDDSKWSTGKKGDFPDLTGVTRYYRTAFKPEIDYQLFSIVEFGIFTKNGLILYINGNEVYRSNMQEGNIYSFDPAIYGESEPLFKKVTIPVHGGLLTTDSITIAVEVHTYVENPDLPTKKPHHSSLTKSQTNDKPDNTDYFQGFAVFITGPTSYRVLEGTPYIYKDPIEPASNNRITAGETSIEKAFDDNRDTIWSFDINQGAASYQYYNDRKEWISKYTLVPSTDLTHAPTSWILYGYDTVSDKFYILDVQSNVKYSTDEDVAHTFTLNTNMKAFNEYLFVFNKVLVGTTGEIAEIYLYAENTTPEKAVLAYSSSSFVFYKYMNYVRETPIVSGFSSFSISPSQMPEGLSFDVNSGIIYGYPSATTELLTYTINGTYKSIPNQSPQTIIIHLQVKECGGSDIHLSLLKSTSNIGEGQEEQYSLLNNHGEVVFNDITVPIFTQSYYQKTTHFCIPQGIYSIEASSNSNNGWSMNSYLLLSLYKGASKFDISKYSLWKKDKEQFNFTAKYETRSQIKLLANSTTSAPSDWMSTSFDDSNWTNYIPSSSSLSASGPLYYRQKFTVTDVTNAQSYQFYFRCRAGALVYVDGILIYSANIENPSASITPTTIATQGESETNPSPWRYTTTLMDALPAGDHIIAVVVVPQTLNSLIIDYDSMLQLSFTSHLNTRTYGITATESSSLDSNTRGSMAFDNNMYTYWGTEFTSEHPSPQYIQGTYLHYSKEIMNKYCVGSHWNKHEYDPKSWFISASNDGETWTTIDTEDNIVFTKYSDKQCFYVPNQKQSYNSYRFNCVSAYGGSICAVTELFFYSVDYRQIHVPSLSYDKNTIIGYIGSQISSGIPSSEYYRNFTVSPTLPSGLSISTGTGIISGIPTTTSNATYTIYATAPDGTQSSVSLMIITQKCHMPNMLLTLFFEHMTEDSSQNGFKVLNTKGEVIEAIEKFPVNIDQWYHTMCLDANIYDLVLLDDSNDGWGSGKVSILQEDGYILQTDTCRYGESPKTIQINAVYIIYPYATHWKYMSWPQGDAPSDWAEAEFDDGEWNDDIPGGFKSLSGVTTYYRSTFLITELDPYVTYHIMVNVKAGVGISINGHHIYSNNLPEDYDCNTLATDTFINAKHLFVSGSIQFGSLILGQNILGVEIHRYDDTSELTFDGSLILGFNNTKKVTEGLVTSSIPGYQDETRDERAPMAFDGSYTTKYYADTCDGEISLTYTYTDKRKEYISRLAFTRGNSEEKIPDSFKLVASQDNEQWTTLYIGHNIKFGRYGTKEGTVSFDFFNDRSYRMYKLFMESSSCSTGIEAAEVELYAVRLGMYCLGDDQYAGVLEGQKSYRDCPSYFSGYYYKECYQGTLTEEKDMCTVMIPEAPLYRSQIYDFRVGEYNSTDRPEIPAAGYRITIEPSLPEGLSLNRYTGVISGTLKNMCTVSEFTVYVTNDAGQSSAELSFNCLPPFYDPTMMTIAYIVIGILLCLIAGVVVFCIYRRRLSVQKKRKHYTKSPVVDDDKISGLIASI